MFALHRFSVVLLLLCLASLAWADEDDILSGFPPPQEDFKAHIEDVRRYLLQTQLPQRQPADVEYNVPFEMDADPQVAYRGRYLLIHGLNDSPAVWRDVGRELARRGYDVRAILLPGHGNTPEAQLQVTWEMWLDAARGQLALWRSADQPFFIGGFSLGGVIATLLALENEGVDGLLLFSPAFRSSKSHLLRWASLVSRFKPWVFGKMIIEDNPTKYNSIPINAAAQYYQATKYLQRIWRGRKLSMPVLVVASLDDSVVSIDSLRKMFSRRFTSPRKRLILYAHGEVQAGPAEVIRESEYPEYRILNQSHLSLLNSPDNDLFGRDGRQRVCNGNEWAVFSACLYYAKGDHWKGAEGTPSPDGVPVKRTTFNPDFDFVMQQFDEVFAGSAD